MTRTTVRGAAVLLLLAGLVAFLNAQDVDLLKVGVQRDGRIVVPTNQILQPAGTQVSFPGRPVDLLAIEDGRTLVVKNRLDLVFIDVATGAVRQTLPSTPRGQTAVGFSVVGLAARDDRIYASDVQRRGRVARGPADGAYAWEGPIVLPAPAIGGEPHPAGLALIGVDRLAVTATRANAIHFVNLATRQVEQTVPVGVAPYTVLPVGPDTLY